MTDHQDSVSGENMGKYENSSLYRISDSIPGLISDLIRDYDKGRTIDNQDIFTTPNRYAVQDIIEKLNRLIYGGYYADKTYRIYQLNTSIASLADPIEAVFVVWIPIMALFSPDHLKGI